jgi:hypothetical protein
MHSCLTLGLVWWADRFSPMYAKFWRLLCFSIDVHYQPGAAHQKESVSTIDEAVSCYPTKPFAQTAQLPRKLPLDIS